MFTNKVFKAGLIVLFIGIALSIIGVFTHIFIEIPGFVLMTLGFSLMVAGYFYHKRKTWLYLEGIRQEKIKSKKQQAVSNEVQKPKPTRKRSGVIYTAKSEKMSALLYEAAELMGKGYDLNSNQIREIRNVYNYVKRDYKWFTTRIDKVPSLDFVILKNNLEVAEIILNQK